MYLEACLSGGLTNQKKMLLAAVRCAVKKNYTLIEPYWQNPETLFSDVYDFKYFSDCLSPDLKTISREKLNNISNPKVSSIGANELWDLQRELKQQVRQMQLLFLPNDIETRFWVAFQLSSPLQDTMKLITDHYQNKHWACLHMRVEEDWLEYSQKKDVPEYEESIYISPAKIRDKLFATSFEQSIEAVYLAISPTGRHEDPYKDWESHIAPVHDKSNMLKHHSWSNAIQSSAIDFEVSCVADIFIGTTRSSFSNAVTLQRMLNLQESSFLYNFIGNKCLKRYDGGLYPDAKKAIDKTCAPKNNFCKKGF